MDDSMSSTNYMSKSTSPREKTDSFSQESGWTLYLEDFIANNNDIGDESCSDYQSSSMVSDTAWSAVRKLNDDNQEHVTAACVSLHRIHNKLISKRRKTKSTFVDQELEDTASSPVDSPKVADLNGLYMKSNEMGSKGACQQAYEAKHFWNEHLGKDDLIRFPQDSGHFTQLPGEGIDMGFSVTELRRKGLCLVPVSMLLKSLS